MKALMLEVYLFQGESGEQVGGELESVTSSAGCFVQCHGEIQQTGLCHLLFACRSEHITHHLRNGHHHCIMLIVDDC